MIRAIYFERRDRTHITLDEWRDAVDSVEGVRRVAAAAPNTDGWIGYFVNPLAQGPQFHDHADRRHDAEVYFSSCGRWRRVFYWHSLPRDQGGVINFEGGLTATDGEADPIQDVSQELAHRLSARLADEDHTWYED